MESSAVSAATSAPEPSVRPQGRPAPPADAAAPPPPELRPRAQSDAEFLAHQTAAESGPAQRETMAKFVVDPKTHDVSVQILDANSQEVIRTIPNEDLRQMAQRYRASNGFVLDSAV